MTAKSGSVQDHLNKSMPIAAKAKLGDTIADLIAQVNAQGAALAALTTKYNAALAKLDADAGVTDTNYAATEGATAFTATTVVDLENR